MIDHRPSQRLSTKIVQWKSRFCVREGSMTPFEWITTLVSITALVVQATGVLRDKRQG
jgi:hypothetical protein